MLLAQASQAGALHLWAGGGLRGRTTTVFCDMRGGIPAAATPTLNDMPYLRARRSSSSTALPSYPVCGTTGRGLHVAVVHQVPETAKPPVVADRGSVVMRTHVTRQQAAVGQVIVGPTCCRRRR